MLRLLGKRRYWSSGGGKGGGGTSAHYGVGVQHASCSLALPQTKIRNLLSLMSAFKRRVIERNISCSRAFKLKDK